MELAFLGHQTWLISHKNTNIIIDPLLLNDFGHSTNINFEVYPSRKVDIDKMPTIDAIILSHEHLDHFHIPSLRRLSKDIPFYVSHLLPSCIKVVIKELGFKLIEVKPLIPIELNDLRFTFYPSASETVFWEKRVVQVLFEPMDFAGNGVFIAVDALISEEFKEVVNNGGVDFPRAIVISNNSQVVPPGGVGAHTNLLPLQERLDKSMPGLQILHSLLGPYLKGLEEVNEIIFCGNGFITGSGCHSASELFGPFLFSDNKKLATLASELTVDKVVLGPYPGESYNFDSEKVRASKVNWIVLDEERISHLQETQKKFLNSPKSLDISPIVRKSYTDVEATKDLQDVVNELPHMARAIMMSDIGKIALSLNEHLDEHLGAKRVLLRLLTDEQAYQYALDFSTAEFIEDDTAVELLLEKFPFGLEVFLSDFAAIIQGKLQIWDLAGNAIRSWYVSDAYSNFVSFLYAYFGEQIRPDLAKKVYDAALARV